MSEYDFDPREMMELAIRVMRESVTEPRVDEKPCPAVGCVLRQPDGTIDTAARGELRYGDHAEFAVLERKNRAMRLDGSVMFTTLEPCAPGARSHPKISCAERIVLARIAEVWIGVEDSDPLVDRRGIAYLEENGVVVHLFDRDLQDEITKANTRYFTAALQRAATQERPPEVPTLSSLEQPIGASDTRDFSRPALKSYCEAAGINYAVDSEDFERRLELQGLLARSDGVLKPTGFGLVLFGTEPRTAIPQAGLLATIKYAGGEEEIEDFVGPAVLIPGEVKPWLEGKLPNILDRSKPHSERIPALPYEVVREAIVNALVHRDYDIDGAKCHLVVTPESIVVQSPGMPMPQVGLEKLQTFSAPKLSRNPSLHFVFHEMDLAEERALGMRTFSSLPDKYGLPLPRFSYEDPYLTMTIYRSSVATELSLPAVVREALSPAERHGWQWLSTRLAATSRDYAEALRIPQRTAQNHLKRFTELGLVEKSGAGRATTYRIVGAT